MLRLKSVVKNEVQLLATGWKVDENGHFYLTFPFKCDPSDSFSRFWQGIITQDKKFFEPQNIGINDYNDPDKCLLIDQWGFVRDPNTLDIVMFDGSQGAAKVFEVRLHETYPIKVNKDTGSKDSYKKDGCFYKDQKLPQLSKYPYSFEYGGYTPFDFDELVEAFDCSKQLEMVVAINTVSKEEIVTTFTKDGYEYKLTRTKI